MNTQSQSSPTPRKHRRRLSLAIGLIAGALALSTMAVAGPGGGKGRGRGGPGLFGPRLMRAVQTLDLTEQQDLQLVRMKRKMRELRKEGLAYRTAAFETVKKELAKANPDAQALKAAANAMMEHQKRAMETGIDEYVAFHKTLSAEQRSALNEKIQKMEERMKRFRGRE